MLGAPLAAPAKLVFKALGLSAQSDVTEEDVLSFVDDVEEHDLIDESQKKMITNIFEPVSYTHLRADREDASFLQEVVCRLIY